MNAARRARKHANHVGAGGHSSNDHVSLAVQALSAAWEKEFTTPGPVNCPVCRPAPKTWDRDLAGKAT